MPKQTSEKNNKINYVEFVAEDLAVYKQFYGSVFGWIFQDWRPDYISFEGAHLDGGVRGGESPQSGGPLVILYADEIDATAARVEAAGGVIVDWHDFPGGRRFHFRDPAGNVLGVWTKAEAED